MILWQMLLPCVIMVDVITTEGDVTSSITARWQMLLPYDVVVDVEPYKLHVATCCLAGVICQVADVIATVEWMCVGRCYYQVADGIAKGLFNLVSVLRC